MASIRLCVLGACLCTMLASSFFLQSCFVFLCFFRVFKMFLVGLATVVRLCFMSDIVLLIDWLHCIDLFSCIAASLFNKLTLLYFTSRNLYGILVFVLIGRVAMSSIRCWRLLALYSAVCLSAHLSVCLSRIGISISRKSTRLKKSCSDWLNLVK